MLIALFLFISGKEYTQCAAQYECGVIANPWLFRTNWQVIMGRSWYEDESGFDC
jgi:hypothetical protein